MTSISRHQVPASTTLLMRILERPGLVAAVRELPGAVLGKLIDRIGLEDAGELVALATTAQLERVFDDDLWRADRAGGDETFRPERFALWLQVMLEAGEDALVRRLCELPQDLVALAVHRLVLVMDMDVIEEMLSPGDEEAEQLERALEYATFEEWEELRLIARDPDVWEDVWNALLALDREHHDRLRAILERCCEMSTEYISGQGGLYQVLTADEMLDSDVAAARDDRRVAEGFVSPADARAFLELARRGKGEGERAGERDPITRAYLRGLAGPAAPVAAKAGAPRQRDDARAAPADVGDLAALLREAEVIAPAPAGTPLLAAPAAAAGEAKHLTAPLFEQAMNDLRQRDPGLFDTRVQELGYLVNVWIAGGAHEGRTPRPVEALETVLRTCEAGMRAQLAPAPATPEQALAALAQTPADALFRRGFGGVTRTRAR
ncbi:MAG TPA: DUF6178 family protein [Polyangia bacterium]|jgi:hypothetical protein